MHLKSQLELVRDIISITFLHYNKLVNRKHDNDVFSFLLKGTFGLKRRHLVLNLRYSANVGQDAERSSYVCFSRLQENLKKNLKN